MQVVTPLLREGPPIGTLSLYRAEHRPFTDQQIALLETFADQAVIAIENARLFEELEQRNAELQESNRQVTEALEQQTATGEILATIASSPTDLDAVLITITATAARICGTDRSLIFQLRERDGRLSLRAARRPASAARSASTLMRTRGFAAGARDPVATAFRERRTIRVADMAEAVRTEFPDSRAVHNLVGMRSVVAVPLLRAGESIGTLLVDRLHVEPFTDKQVALLETFADQAVIAIENARLFEELEQRNVDLGEALEQQTATAEILRVIASSPTDLSSVLDTIAGSAARLCEANNAAIASLDGDTYGFVSTYGPTVSDVLGRRSPLDGDTVTSRALLERQTIHVHDLASDAGYERGREVARSLGYRTVVATPAPARGELRSAH